jgi:hypothetical protein
MELTEAQKSKVLSDIKTYISDEWKENTVNKKFAENFSAEIAKATDDKFSFGAPPQFEKGYVRGNITAEGERSGGNTTNIRTINLDLQTPEYTFFWISKGITGDEGLCKRACKTFSYLEDAIYPVADDWGILRTNGIFDNSKSAYALKSYAISVCGEQFDRLNYNLKNCRVNDYEYVQTEDTKVCPLYPIYFNRVDKKGNEIQELLGYYNAEDDSMDYTIHVPLTGKQKFKVVLAVIGVVIFLIIGNACMEM